MRLASVKDIQFEPADNHYHSALVAIGSEPRSTLVATELLKYPHLHHAVHGITFEDAEDSDIRVHRSWFTDAFPAALSHSSPDDDAKVYGLLSDVCETADGSKELHILIDYSSMPRGWYSAVLNWFRSQKRQASVVLDFVYALGCYGGEWVPKAVMDVCAIPGCDGGPSLSDVKIAVFGLGFDRLAPFSVLERIEPDEVLAYVADPGATEDAPERARAANSEFIKDEANITFRLPLCSVEAAYRVLGETISANRGLASVVLVPLGPKPHVLASVLAAYRYPGTACLRVLHRRRTPHRVAASGATIATRVVFETD